MFRWSVVQVKVRRVAVEAWVQVGAAGCAGHMCADDVVLHAWELYQAIHQTASYSYSPPPSHEVTFPHCTAGRLVAVGGQQRHCPVTGHVPTHLPAGFPHMCRPALCPHCKIAPRKSGRPAHVTAAATFAQTAPRHSTAQRGQAQTAASDHRLHRGVSDARMQPLV